jgi:copper chaperone CopZ
VATVTETIEVTGVKCERCVMRLGKALEGHDGLLAANATLMGQVFVTYDDAKTTRSALVAALAEGGCRERSAC